MRDPRILGVGPAELETYTPAELDALLRYAEAKRDAVRSSG